MSQIQGTLDVQNNLILLKYYGNHKYMNALQLSNAIMRDI